MSNYNRIILNSIRINHKNLQNNSVTIRHRDTMDQKRVAISDLKEIIQKEVAIKTWLQKM